jgi:hypothetical protein
MKAVDRRAGWLFLALVVAQAAHSIDEYLFALYEVFAPARLASSLVSDDLATGFAVLNLAIVAFGVWCYLARVRPGHPSARAYMWFWIFVELGNGVLHPAMALIRKSYFPGAATAPILFVLALMLAAHLVRGPRAAEAPHDRESKLDEVHDHV